MRILLWHVHGAWTTAFVSGVHEYVIPVTPDRGPYGRGRARTYPWPDSVVEMSPDQLARADLDVVIVQRPQELELVERWTRRAPGAGLPAVYLEHNTPAGDVPCARHLAADRDDLPLVHVTHFNDLFWDAGSARTAVIEHGIPEPAAGYVGDLRRAGVVTNEPIRRGRVVGADLLPRFAEVAPLDVFGMGVRGLSARLGVPLGEFDDPPQRQMHHELARRRVYLHLTRWTSLGLSLLEAMSMGMPVVAIGATEVARAAPPGAAVVSTDVRELVDATAWLLDDPDAARELGARGREVARARFGLDRFLKEWDSLLEEVTGCASR